MSRVDVMNQILIKLGQNAEVVNPDEDSKAARTIQSVWDNNRDIILRLHLWNFATMRTQLTAVSSPPAHGFEYAFALPHDFLRFDIGKLEPEIIRTDHQIEGASRLLANDIGPVDLVYIRRVADVHEWEPLFTEVFACRVAWQVAITITGDPQIQGNCYQSYQMALREARAVDGRENPPEKPLASSWVTAREDGGTNLERGW